MSRNEIELKTFGWIDSEATYGTWKGQAIDLLYSFEQKGMLTDTQIQLVQNAWLSMSLNKLNSLINESATD